MAAGIRVRARRALALMALAVPLLSGCDKRREALPQELLGTWVTDAPRYAGTSFTFQAPNTLLIQSAAANSPATARRIQALTGKFDSSKNATLYRIEYNEGGDDIDNWSH